MKYKKIIGTLILAFSFNTLTPIFSTKAQAKTDPPNIVGQYAITIDADTGEVIYSKNGDAKSYPASTTKLLTALLLAENKNKEDILKFTESALKQPDYALYRSFGPIPLGTTMSADDVMKSLMLFSGNDIAYLIADNVAGDTSKFSDMMNAKLKEWGLNNSHFVNPNGLHHDNHYTTPFELAVITKKAYENPWVKETMAQSKATVNTSLNKPINLENRNKNVGTDGCVAGKTGYTSPAGRSLAAVYERDGRTIIGVVMKSAYDVQDTQVFKDMKNIIDYSYAAEKNVFMEAGKEVATYPVKYKLFKFFGPEKTIEVPFTLTKNIEIYDNEINKAETKTSFELKESDGWKLAKNPEGAALKVSSRLSSDEYTLKANISTTDLLKQNILAYAISAVAIIAAVLIVLLIIKLISNGNRGLRRSRRTGRRRRRY